MHPLIFQKTVSQDDPATLCEALSRHSNLSKIKVKNALNKGAVWIRRPKGKKQRIRRATATVRPGDGIWLYYDPRILESRPPEARCMYDAGHYSIWYKPAGMLSQGSHFGDHCALTRQIETCFQPRRPVYLVHRLDREVSGLILIAHQKTAAARFSSMIREDRVEKWYQACLKGDLRTYSVKGDIDFPLDGRSAHTSFEVIRYDENSSISTVRVRIQTGRLHQIRRHFHMIGYPVLGDPRYGQDNHSPLGLQLVAFAIGFECPFGNGRIDLSIDPDASSSESILFSAPAR